MKQQHKNLVMALVLTRIVIAAINNIGALSPVRETLNGDQGWF
ncbi:hypothetical protein [Vibrio sp. B1FLJ16]|nr:hypothetical protein [Vibrio sp. B1FLJ16]CAD7806004.1 hypothetical protein ACOMICROBIO_EPCKBFOG_01464 [Vibrio sp. B1FLJ16]CAE6902150.1 hypothetical protein ACOMICROBIO_EPCKBFOG_01464 [Vibrio sp. B1FLJ16]